MLRAYAADRVRAAEETLMATLEDGDLPLVRIGLCANAFEMAEEAAAVQHARQ